MKLIAKKNFDWAHGGSDVHHYEKGQRIETDDVDLIRVALDEGWADPANWEDPVLVREPTKEELLGMRDALASRERELLEQAERLGQQAVANQVEAERLQQLVANLATEDKRLVDAIAQLATDRAAFEAAKPATPAPASGKGKAAAAAAA